jgi:alkyl sulfatase BDS1-like metallo-beta-lactamase superfamily hydrolase
VTLRNGVLIYREADADPDAAASVSVSKMRLLALMGGDQESPGVESTGDASAITALLGVLDPGDPAFAIVTP